MAAHHRVPEAAELGADDGERAGARGRDDERVVLAGHRVLLLRELRHPERMDDVVRGDVELRVPARGQGQRAVGLAVRIGERPGELLGRRP